MTSPLFKKLQLGAQPVIHVLHAPASFDAELARLDGVDVHTSVDGPVAFCVAFAITRVELDAVSATLVGACVEDAVLWVAYPKQTSTAYRCDFNRDSGWDVLRAAGFDTVRAVSIDGDWSALRFRRLAHITRTIRVAQPTPDATGGTA